MAKADNAFVLKQGLLGRRILGRLLKKPRLPLSVGYFANGLDVSDDDLVWCLRFLDANKYVVIKPYLVHVATIRKSQKQPCDVRGIQIMRLLGEHSPRGSVFLSREFGMSNKAAVKKLLELETIGLVSVKPTSIEFVSLVGGRPHILVNSLKLMLRAILRR